MVYQWYYAQAGIKMGPYSAQALQQLAAAGRILPTDTVWRAGTAKGVLAQKVQHLFAVAQVSALEAPVPAPPAPIVAALPPATSQPAAADEEPCLGPITHLVPEEPEPALGTVAPPEPEEPAAIVPTAAPPTTPPAASTARPPKPRKGQAVAIKGAVIVSQDGTRVTYRKKCTVCGHLDGNNHAMPIRSGMTRSDFFCPNCRKNRPVQIQGTIR